MDVVIYDQFFNAPLHRELSFSVFPVEMVYGTVEVKRLLESKNLKKILSDIQTIRRLGEEKWYAAYAAVPKNAESPSQTVTGQIQFKLSKPVPRTYLVAVRQKGWSTVEGFRSDLASALEETPTHIHGVTILENDWYVSLEAYSTPRTGLRCESGNSLLRFVNDLLPAISSMPMYQTSFDRYLDVSTPNKAFQRTRPKRCAAEG
jgi:hypothetical protein